MSAAGSRKMDSCSLNLPRRYEVVSIEYPDGNTRGSLGEFECLHKNLLVFASSYVSTSGLDLLHVARLIRRKFRPLDTDTEGARGLFLSDLLYWHKETSELEQV